MPVPKKNRHQIFSILSILLLHQPDFDKLRLSDKTAGENTNSGEDISEWLVSHEPRRKWGQALCYVFVLYSIVALKNK